jgi:iron complex outermembrane receptor protein
VLNKHSRRNARVRGWLGGCAASTLALATAASLSASPASAQGAAVAVETMIVTAQFREQQIQRTPLAITALSGDVIESRNLTNLEQIGALAPNVGLGRPTQAFGNILSANIRGIAYGDYIVGQEPVVGYYVDDVYYATMPGSIFNLLDLDRIEVLRGPQGTLFGKNTVGGAIRLISKKPKGDGSGYLEATYGQYDRLDFRGAIDVPVIEDKLMVRVTGFSKDRKGYQRNIDFACAFAGTGLAGTLPIEAPPPSCDKGTFGGEDVQGGRVSIRAVITPDIEANIYADIIRDRSPIQADTLIGVASTGPGVDPTKVYQFQEGVPFGVETPLPSTYPAPSALLGLIFLGPASGGLPFDRRFIPADRDVNYANFASASGVRLDPRQTMNAWGTQGTLDWKLRDNLSFKSITGYRTYDIALPNDDDASPLQAPNTLETFIKQEQFSQEGRFNVDLFDKRLRLTVGGYYLRWAFHQRGPVMLEFGPLALFAFQQNDKAVGSHYSGYAHAEFDVTDAFQVYGGYRYSHETKSYRFDHGTGVPSEAVAGIPCLSPPNANVFCDYVSIPTPSFFKFNISDWRLGLKYQITDAVMVYGQVSTGYRASGLQTRPFTVFQFLTGAFGPERDKTYEIGLRSEWFDQRLLFNATVFYNDYNHRQVPVALIDPGPPPSPFTKTTNIGTASIEGVELEVQARPIEGLTIAANWGYIETSQNATPGAPPGFLDNTLPGQNTIYVGAPFGGPKNQVGLAADYRIELGEHVGSLTPGITFQHQSGAQTGSTRALGDIEAASIADGRLKWDAPVGDWSILLTVSNMFDHRYFDSKFDLASFGFATIEGHPNRPREWAVTVRKEF